MDPRPWTVPPHGQIEQLETNLWRVEASLKSPPLERVMTIAKLSTGGLVLHSVVALDDAKMTELDSLGPVKYIVVPNGWHRLDAASYKARYPEARVLAPKASRKKIEKLVKVDGTLEELVDRDVKLGVVEGTRGLEALMTVTSGDRVSLVFTDVIFNMPHRTGLQGFVLKHLMDSSGGPKVTRIGRTFLIKDKPAFAAQLEQLAAQNVTRIVVAHNEVISVDPAGVLRGIAASMR
ncbi:MAG: hypothetical protein ABI704_11080 [Kofleriaceae bacterium]